MKIFDLVSLVDSFDATQKKIWETTLIETREVVMNKLAEYGRCFIDETQFAIQANGDCLMITTNKSSLIVKIRFAELIKYGWLDDFGLDADNDFYSWISGSKEDINRDTEILFAWCATALIDALHSSDTNDLEHRLFHNIESPVVVHKFFTRWCEKLEKAM